MPRLKDRDSELTASTVSAASSETSEAVTVAAVPKSDTSTTPLSASESKGKKDRLSSLRKTASFFRSHPRITKSVLLIAAISGVGIFLILALFREAWSPERDDLKVMHTILKMEMARESALPIDENPQQVVTRSYQTLEPHVADDGWVWVNRFGSTITYGKDGKHLIASCGPYSALYLICNLSEVP